MITNSLPLTFPAFQSFLEVLNCIILLLRWLPEWDFSSQSFIQFFLKNLEFSKENSLVGQWFLLLSNATMKSVLKSRFKGFLLGDAIAIVGCYAISYIFFSPYSVTIKVLSQSAWVTVRYKWFPLILNCFNSHELCFLVWQQPHGVLVHMSHHKPYTKTKELLLSTTWQDTNKAQARRLHPKLGNFLQADVKTHGPHKGQKLNQKHKLLCLCGVPLQLKPVLFVSRLEDRAEISSVCRTRTCREKGKSYT